MNDALWRNALRCAGQRFNVVHSSRFVVDMHNGNQPRIWPHRRPKRLRGYFAPSVCGQQANLRTALLFQVAECFIYAAMLALIGNHMRMHHTLRHCPHDSVHIGFCAPRGEDDLFLPYPQLLGKISPYLRQ